MSRPFRFAAAGIVVAACGVLAGCVPGERMHFEQVPAVIAKDFVYFDTDRDGLLDFRFVRPAQGHRLDELAYDDNEDGTPDRRFRLSDYHNDSVPHLIVLIDSIPFEALRQRFERDEFTVLRAFHEPTKLIAPFPSMSALCFSSILHAPPMPGPINRSFDPRPQTNSVNNLITKRLNGHRNPWQQRLHYNIDYRDNGTAFLKPRPWMKVEFERARRAFDASPDRTTIVFISSSAAMMMKYGERGLEECLDGLETFVTQVLYERRGAVKISILSDHGHNVMQTTWIDVEQTLADAGFRVAKKLEQPNDVFVEMDGLLTYFGVHTQQPAAVGDALLNGLPEIETVSYVDGYDVVVRSHAGAARVSRDAGRRFTYTPETADVLGYGEGLSGKPLDADGWFAQTVDHEFPDGPTRLWEAFHGRTQQTPQVMVTVKDGYCAGIEWFQWFVKMRSSHGGLNQVNSAAVLLTMRGPTPPAMRSGGVMQAIQPGYVPRIVSPGK
ncbi:MAG: hypothetical protein AAF333_13850 [Planctomycetota bacterium]